MVHIRYPVLIVFILTLIGAAYLGFAQIEVVHDKLLHFVIFCILTVEFYFIFDAQFKSLKIVRYLTVAVCTFGGSISSEVVQKFVNKERVFDPYDILYNIGGSLLGLAICVAHSNYRKSIAKRERSRHLRMGGGAGSIEETIMLEDEAGYNNPNEQGESGRNTPSDNVKAQMKD
ncbi:uncharacterized protein LODBEIA_P14290 [Lodderomyces beijingensis]|uniref:VanZ-like domain-containing protein n=1 Tax=Lodderomyces beijingensis TaxID=1775926 RepID=A0ABP0ZJ23_9ASCO